MKLHQLQALVASADHGSIRAAARSLGVSQAAVTRSLRELEVAENLPLLIRRPSGLSFTDFGTSLLVHARLILNQMNQANAHLSEMRGRAEGQLCIGVTPWVVHTFLPETVVEFRKKMPAVRLEFYESLMAVAQPLLRDGHMDFLIGFLASPASEFSSEPLATYESAILARKGHPRENVRSIHDLIDQNWTLNAATDGFELLMKELFYQFGASIEQSKVFKTHSWSIMQSFIESADMLTCGPAVLGHIPAFRDRLVIVPVEEKLDSRHLSIIARGSSTRSTAAVHFIDCLNRVIAKQFRAAGEGRQQMLRTVKLLAT